MPNIDCLPLSDAQIVQGILSNDSKVIEYFFFTKCSKLFDYIISTVLDSTADKRELVNELYLYLQQDNWHKVRLFDYRSKLMTWTTVVAIRFFQKKRLDMIDRDPLNALLNKERHAIVSLTDRIDRRMDIKNALQKMTNERYRNVIINLDLKDKKPEEVANEMSIGVDNLYNIHRRAHLQLKAIMRKEDYYD